MHYVGLGSVLRELWPLTAGDEKWPGVLLGLLLLCMHLPLTASEELQKDPMGASLQEVVWSRTDFAPFFILEGEYRNQGIGDNLIKLFSDKVVGYRHNPTEMTLGRMLESAKNGMPVCHMALLKTLRREAFIEYSDPIMINYANGIVTTADGLARFGMSVDAIRPIDLSRITGKPLQISVHDRRSYSSLIDKIIASEREKKDSIFVVKMGRKQHDLLMRQLLANRLDGIIARPEEIYFDKLTQHIDQPLFFIDIKFQPVASLARVGCAKGAWNDDLLKQINRLIRDPQIRNEINQSYINWLPNQLRSRYAADQAEMLNY